MNDISDTESKEVLSNSTHRNFNGDRNRWCVPGVEVGNYKWGWSLFWGDKNVLELDSGDGPTTL